MPDVQQAKMLRRRGFQQREDLFTSQPGEETGENSAPPPLTQRTLGICEIGDLRSGEGGEREDRGDRGER